MVTPMDIYNQVLEANREADFLQKILFCKDGFAISEIADGRFFDNEDGVIFCSDAYQLQIPVADADIAAAVRSGRYVTAFISRKDDKGSLHFLVHRCLTENKDRNEEEIAQEVVRYMILHTIVALRLDSEQKLDAYLS